MSGPTRAVRILAALLLVGCGLSAFIAAKRGLADVMAQDARYEFERWQAGKINPDVAAVTALGEGLQSALALDRANPDLLSDLGRLDSRRARNGPPGDAAAGTARGAALASFRQAARLRPTSGHSWANVALARFSVGAVDSEFAAALERAMRNAPSQPQVQLMGIQLGLASWQALTEPMQQEIAGAVRAQAEWKLTNQKPALVQILRNYRRSDLACPWAGAAFPCPGA